MNIIRMIYIFYKIKLLSPTGLYRLISSIRKYGINIMALLGFAARTHGDQVALVDENETLTYKQLLSQSRNLATLLHQNYHIQSGQKVGFICRNHGSLVKSLFAVSQLGADIYLLNVEMSKSQFNFLLIRYDFDFLIYDREWEPIIEQSGYAKDKLLSYHDHLPTISKFVNDNMNEELRLQRTSLGKLVILTGGTTGKSKTAAHQPSVFNYLNPFITLIARLKLLKYKTAYIATPIYHGYGVAILLLLIAMGKKMVIYSRFDADKACRLIHEHQVEVVTVVPLMIHKMLSHHPDSLKSLACIASGGAELNPKLVAETFNKLGNILYNLYGTSEAGLNMIATPQDLKYAATTIGRKITGARLKIVDDHKNEVRIGEVGQFCIKNKWSRTNGPSSWIETGDLGYRDDKGYYYLCGRIDDLVVSAGENVYPIEVEQALIKHPCVQDVAVIGISDEHFGQRLKAFIVLDPSSSMTAEELLTWLRPQVARFQLPKEVVFIDEMPYTSLGKIDRKQLRK